jgi:hypothetical protein
VFIPRAPQNRRHAFRKARPTSGPLCSEPRTLASPKDTASDEMNAGQGESHFVRVRNVFDTITTATEAPPYDPRDFHVRNACVVSSVIGYLSSS